MRRVLSDHEVWRGAARSLRFPHALARCWPSPVCVCAPTIQTVADERGIRLCLEIGAVKLDAVSGKSGRGARRQRALEHVRQRLDSDATGAARSSSDGHAPVSAPDVQHCGGGRGKASQCHVEQLRHHVGRSRQERTGGNGRGGGGGGGGAVGGGGQRSGGVGGSGRSQSRSAAHADLCAHSTATRQVA